MSSSSSNTRTLALLGGTGFIGSHLANRLVRDGWRLRVLSRRRERSKHLILLPGLELLEGDPYDPRVLSRLLQGAEALVNLVGILNERGDDGSGFQRAHVELTSRALDAARSAGIQRYLHMSALNASPEGPSHYLRTKGEAEKQALAAADPCFAVTVFRPSVVFGPGDGFYQRFAGLLRLSPVLPLACASTRFAPVYVLDVAEAFCRALEDRATHGQRYDLCGPEVFTLEEVVRYTARVCGLRRLIVPLSRGLSSLQAGVFEHLPGKPFSRDNFRSTELDSVCTGALPGLEALGIVPTAVDTVVPQYLGHARVRDHYDLWRGSARRS